MLRALLLILSVLLALVATGEMPGCAPVVAAAQPCLDDADCPPGDMCGVGGRCLYAPLGS